jgi:hypothetical protein
MMKLEITEDEREALLALLEDELRDPKFPLSPETEALRSVAEKLRDEGGHKPSRR